jgi:hypothetical protein
MKTMELTLEQLQKSETRARKLLKTRKYSFKESLSERGRRFGRARAHGGRDGLGAVAQDTDCGRCSKRHSDIITRRSIIT